MLRRAGVLVLSLIACRMEAMDLEGPDGADPVSEEPAPVSPQPTTSTPPASPQPTASTASRPSTSTPAAGARDPEGGRLVGITRAHNAVRDRLGVAPLVWAPELARYAQAWADKLKAKKCALQHRPHQGADAQKYGENIYSASGSTPTANDVVRAWAAEVKGYDARTNRCSGVCGHYTQVVWRKSTRVGCGMASCGGTEVWVCNYDPPGNFNGERPY